jgi:hypothetical protein
MSLTASSQTPASSQTLSFLGAWLLMKKGRKSGGGSHRHSRREKPGYGGHGSKVGAGVRPEVKVEENLPERVDDSEVMKSMQDLNEIIDLHCENYFHLKPVDDNPREVEQRLVDFGYNTLNTSGPAAAELVTLLQNSQSRLSAVRLSVTSAIFPTFFFLKS